MEGHDPHIILRLKTRDPIELGDFVAAFTALGNEFTRYIRRERPDWTPEASIFVREVREGSIEAELIPWAIAGVVTMINNMDKILVLDQFITLYGARISRYFKRGGRLPDASRSELGDFMDQVKAIANDPNGAAELEAVTFEDGRRKVRAAVKFRTQEARLAREQLIEHRRELENKLKSDHERVLLLFVRPSIEGAKLGKRSGERGLIEAIHPKPLPIVYASDLSEQRIHHEMREAEGNVFRKLFDVDVNLEMSGDGKPLAYRIMAVHSAIDAPDDDDAA